MNDEKKMNGLRTLLLITIELVLSGILKDRKGIAAGSAWYVLWLIALIVNLFRI